MVIKSSSAFLATTILATSALAWETTTTAPVDPTDAPWLDWESTTTTTTKPVVKTTTTAEDPWLDWSSTTTTTKPVVKATTTVDPWLDWASTTTTTKPVVKATTTVDPWVDWASTTTTKPVSPATTSVTHVWDDWTSVAPVDPAVCKVVTVTYTGVGFWVPDPAATWGDWPVAPASTTTKPVVKTTTTADPNWSDWVSTTTTKPVVQTTTTADPNWSDWEDSTTVAPTTAKPTTAKPATTTTTTTTTKAPAPKATCPADNGKTVLAGGSCGCGFQVNCGVRASPDANSKFWEQTSGAIVPTLAECLALCDDNSKCEAALWVDDSTSGDYHKCWQISGLGAPTGSGVAQISYKKSCSGSCSYTYGQ